MNKDAYPVLTVKKGCYMVTEAGFKVVQHVDMVIELYCLVEVMKIMMTEGSVGLWEP